MDFFEVVEKRHSYRGAFKNQEMPRADLEKILDTGIRAPSGCNAQTTSFVAVTDPALRDAITELMPEQVKTVLGTAQAIIVVLSTEPEVYKGMSFGVQDFAASAENMLMAATALGYASVWIEGDVYTDGRQEAIAKLLNVPSERKVRVLLPMGVPEAEKRQARRKEMSERVQFNRFE